MTEIEAYLEKRYGIEMAAAYRADMGYTRSGKLLTERDELIISWEIECRRILGERAYKESRYEKYKDLIRKMREEENEA